MDDILKITIPHADLICYADDTVVLFHGTDWEDVYKKAESGMVRISNWLDTNLLTLNIKKTKYIAFRKTLASKLPSWNLKIHGNLCRNSFNFDTKCLCSNIDRVDGIRYLGVIIDQHLSFKPQIRELAKRVRKQIYIMKLLRDSASVEVKKLVYIALCQSLIQYCIVIWGGVAKSHLIILERAQRAVFKTLLHKPYRFPTETLYAEASLLSVRKLFILNVTTKSHIDVSKRSDINSLHAKRTFRVPTPAVKSVYAQRLPHFLHLHVYNAVTKQCNLRNLTRKQIKNRLTSWLLNLSYDEAENVIRAVK